MCLNTVAFQYHLITTICQRIISALLLQIYSGINGKWHKFGLLSLQIAPSTSLTSTLPLANNFLSFEYLCQHCIQEDCFTLFMPHCLDSFCQKLDIFLTDTVWVISPQRSSFDPTACDCTLCQDKKGMCTLPPCPMVSIQTQSGVQARRETQHTPSRSVGNQSPVCTFKTDFS